MDAARRKVAGLLMHLHSDYTTVFSQINLNFI